jgi:hypothetical protein
MSSVDGKCSNVAGLKNGRLMTSRQTYSIGDESEFHCSRGFIIGGMEKGTVHCTESRLSKDLPTWRFKHHPNADGCTEGSSFFLSLPLIICFLFHQYSFLSFSVIQQLGSNRNKFGFQAVFILTTVHGAHSATQRPKVANTKSARTTWTTARSSTNRRLATQVRSTPWATRPLPDATKASSSNIRKIWRFWSETDLKFQVRLNVISLWYRSLQFEAWNYTLNKSDLECKSTSCVTSRNSSVLETDSKNLRCFF